jgi:hypothetical protein
MDDRVRVLVGGTAEQGGGGGVGSGQVVTVLSTQTVTSFGVGRLVSTSAPAAAAEAETRPEKRSDWNEWLRMLGDLQAKVPGAGAGR